MAALLLKKTSTKVFVEYSNFNNVFLVENIAKLSKNTRINEFAIKLEESNQTFFKFIYYLGLIKLKTLETYIKTNLANSFIWPFKFLTKAFIFFDKKLNRSLWICVNYWDLNNLTIEN